MYAKDSINQTIHSQDIRTIAANYQKEKEMQEKNKHKRHSFQFLLLIPLIILLSVGMALWRRKLWKKRAALQVQEIQAAMKEEFAPIQQAMDESIHLRWNTTRFLKQCRKIQNSEDEKAFQRAVILEAKAHCSGFIFWFVTCYPELKEADKALACLLFSQVPIKELSDMYCISQEAVYTRCSRLYQKLGIQVIRGRTPAFRKIMIRKSQQTPAPKSSI